LPSPPEVMKNRKAFVLSDSILKMTAFAVFILKINHLFLMKSKHLTSNVDIIVVNRT
jgi:hypothetical protein